LISTIIFLLSIFFKKEKFMSVKPVSSGDFPQIVNKEQAELPGEGSKADAVAKKTLKASKKDSKKKMKCEHINPNTGERCSARIPVYLQSIICRCGKQFCSKHRLTINHNCKVLPSERTQTKANHASFRGSFDSNCVA
jgi:hypothetical protein